MGLTKREVLIADITIIFAYSIVLPIVLYDVSLETMAFVATIVGSPTYLLIAFFTIRGPTPESSKVLRDYERWVVEPVILPILIFVCGNLSALAYFQSLKSGSAISVALDLTTGGVAGLLALVMVFDISAGARGKWKVKWGAPIFELKRFFRWFANKLHLGREESDWIKDFDANLSPVLDSQPARPVPFKNLQKAMDNVPNTPWGHEVERRILKGIDYIHSDFTQQSSDGERAYLATLVRIIKRAGEGDTQVKVAIKQQFTRLSENLYTNRDGLRRNANFIFLLEWLHDYDSDYLLKLVNDAIQKWSNEDFADGFKNLGLESLKHDKPALAMAIKAELYDLAKSGVEENSRRRATDWYGRMG